MDRWNGKKIFNESVHVGYVVNFKIYSESSKLKSRIYRGRENWQIHKDVHEPIISRELFEEIQKSFGDTKCRKPKCIPQNVLAGFLRWLRTVILTEVLKGGAILDLGGNAVFYQLHTCGSKASVQTVPINWNLSIL